MIPLVFALVLAQDKIVFEGKVLNSLTGEPLKKAEVILDEGNTRYAVTSGSEGKFRFEGIEPGEYHSEVKRQGFVPNDEEPWVTFAPGEQIKDVVIKLTPQAIIAGHVVDEDGDPVPGLSVYAARTIHVNGRAIVLGTQGTITDIEGYFVAGELDAGRYYLSAEPTRHYGGPKPAKPGHPGREDDFIRVDDPIPRDVTPGAALRNIELHIRKSAVFRIRGRISNPRNDSAPIELLPADGVSTVNLPRASPHNGAFELEGIPPGSYVLSVPTYTTPEQRAANTPMFCRVPVTVADHDIDGLTIELTPGSSLEGTVKMDDGSRFAKPQTLQLIGNFATAPVVAKEDGTFGWTNLAPKKYGIDYGPPEGHYVKSIQFNHQPAKMMQIDLTSGISGTVDIVVAPNAASLAVTVEGGKHAQVALWSDSTFETWETETNGANTFDHLAPGEYQILAWQKVETEFVNIPEFRSRFEAQKITLTEGSHENIEVKLIPKLASDAEIAKLQ
jgi:hypothetical protein